jgi:hypothetical protein
MKFSGFLRDNREQMKNQKPKWFVVWFLGCITFTFLFLLFGLTWARGNPTRLLAETMVIALLTFCLALASFCKTFINK